MASKMRRGIIELEQMEFYAYHGCFKEEQVVGNKFVVDVSFSTDCSVPAQTDDIKDAINYVEIYRIVKKQMAVKSHLLEHVADRILNDIIETFPDISDLKVKVAKVNPPVGGQIKDIAVTLTSS